MTLAAQAEPAPRVLLLDCMGGGTESAGISVEAERTDGGWDPIAALHPRREWNPLALGVGSAHRLRLTLHDALAIRFAGELVDSQPASPHVAHLVGANSSFSGDVYDAAHSAVDTSLAMVAGDTLTLAFADVTELAEGSMRTWLLEVDGTPVTPRLAQSLAQHRGPVERGSIPTRFALYPAAPNPARGTVRLAFDLPLRARVRLEIFDPQGRRVRRLEADFVAGRQGFEWDLRHGDGPRVAPGIYSYQLSAGSFRALGRVVVLR